jgi:hypothetical protein
MNVPFQQKSNKVQPTSGWRYAVSQYFTMLSRWGSKFVYFVQWSVFNFGFHVIVFWGKNKFNLIFLFLGLYKSYNYAKRLKIEMGPQTVKGGLVGDF